MSGIVKVLVVGQTPPPWHGQAIMIDRLLRGPFARVRLYHVRMAFSDSISDVGRFRLAKLWHLASVIAQIVYHRVVHGTNVLYYPPAGPDRVPLYRDLAILLCTRWMFRRTILHFHAGGVSQLYPQLSRPMQWMFRRALFSADAAIRVSHGSPADAVALQAPREYIIPNGIEDESARFAKSRSVQTSASITQSKPASVEFGSHENGTSADVPSSSVAICEAASLRILFVGILRQSKGLLVLIEACGQLAARGVPFELQVVGQFQTSEFETEVRRRVNELELDHQVTFLGQQSSDAKWEAYAQADVFCLPTFYEAETFAIVLLEAMSLGLPVVTTHWRGIPEIVDDGRTGFLVDTQDATAVADRLEQLQADPALRQQLGVAGRDKFLREFTAETFWRRMEDVFVETTGA